jgi:hypothetical protein
MVLPRPAERNVRRPGLSLFTRQPRGYSLAVKKASVGRVILRWVLGVLGTAITALIVSTLVPYLQGKLIDAWLPQIAQQVRDWATYPVPAWVVAAALLALLLLRLAVRGVRRKANPDADLFGYTTDSFGPWHFHWRWSRDRFGRRAIRNLTPICSVHDLALGKNGRALACPKCGRSFPALDRQSLDHFRQTIAKKAMVKYGVEL